MKSLAFGVVTSFLAAGAAGAATVDFTKDGSGVATVSSFLDGGFSGKLGAFTGNFGKSQKLSNLTATN